MTNAFETICRDRDESSSQNLQFLELARVTGNDIDLDDIEPNSDNESKPASESKYELKNFRGPKYPPPPEKNPVHTYESNQQVQNEANKTLEDSDPKVSVDKDSGTDEIRDGTPEEKMIWMDQIISDPTCPVCQETILSKKDLTRTQILNRILWHASAKHLIQETKYELLYLQIKNEKVDNHLKCPVDHCQYEAKYYRRLLIHYTVTHPSIVKAFWQLCQFKKTKEIEYEFECTDNLKKVPFRINGFVIQRTSVLVFIKFNINRSYRQLVPCYGYGGFLKWCTSCQNRKKGIKVHCRNLRKRFFKLVPCGINEPFKFISEEWIDVDD